MATLPRADRGDRSDGARDRGPALGGRSVRRVLGAPHRAHRGAAAARRRHRPPRGRGAPPLLAPRAPLHRALALPLTDRDVETLITQSLPEADPELIQIVLERAGGSPLYAEQLAAMLRERALPIAGGALDETMIPASVQALIAARIDALPPEPKRVLMEASVVGKTFWSGAVASLGEHDDLGRHALGELVRREFCRPVHPSTMEGDAEFGFWHALVRDVAYAELTRAERATMHAAQLDGSPTGPLGRWGRTPRSSCTTSMQPSSSHPPHPTSIPSRSSSCSPTRSSPLVRPPCGQMCKGRSRCSSERSR